jgi:hypothetical protein
MNSYRNGILLNDQRPSLWQRSRHILQMSLLLVAVFSLQNLEPVFAQPEDGESYSIGEPEPDYYTLSDPDRVMENRGFGWWGNLGHIAGQTVGREESISTLEVSPYLFTSNDGVLFGDGRLYRTNTAGLGGSGGLGYRQYVPMWDRLFGFTGWYDRDDSLKSGAFEQWTMSAETLGEYWDLRANYYKPVSQKVRVISNELTPGSAHFEQNFLLYGLTTTFGTALEGFDAEFGVPFRTKFMLDHNVKAYGGTYNFQQKDADVDDFWGWKARVAGELVQNINFNLELTSDNVYKTNVQFGISWTFDPNNIKRERNHLTTRDRMLEPVKRLYNVSVVQNQVQNPDQRAINPATGNPYFFRHVDSNAVGLNNGTFENPYTLISSAQVDTNYDIIYVHADSVFTGAEANIVTDAGKLMLGEGNGVVHTINESILGNIQLPRATLGNLRPTLLNSTGNGVELASNSEFSGFIIDTPAGNGFVANGITNGKSHDVDILDAAGQGMTLTNTSGQLIFENILIDGALGDAFEVTGGNAGIIMTDSTINNTSNRAAVINGTTGGFVNLLTTTITDTGGTGILVNNTAGSVTFGTSTITNSTSTGVDIQGGTGRVTFGNTLNITNSTDVGFNVNATGATSSIILADLNIDDRNDIGINLTDVSGSFTVNGITTIDQVNSGTGAAINFQDSSGLITFNNINIDESGGTGIAIGELGTENTGTFRVNGTTNILNITDESIYIMDDSARVIFDSPVSITNRGDRGIAVESNNANVDFNAGVIVTNSSSSTESAIEVLNSNSRVTFGNTTVTNTLLNAGVNIDNSVAVAFDSLSLTTNGNAGTGDGLVINDTGSVSISGGSITALNGKAVDITNSGISISLGNVSNSNDEYAIGIFESDGTFNVTGSGGTSGNPGGNIQGNSIAGVLLEDIDGDNTESVSINGMQIRNNLIGISATNTDTLTVNTSLIQQNVSYGLDFLNVGELNLTNNSFTANGTAAGAGTIRGLVNRQFNSDNDPYSWLITGNNITETNGNNIDLQGIVGSNGAELELLFDSNTLQNTGSGVTGLNLQWDGIVTGEITTNNITITPNAGNSGVGINFENDYTGNTGDSTSTYSTLLVQNNFITNSDVLTTGMRYTAAGDVSFDIYDNTISMSGGAGTGMQFNLTGTASDVDLTNNIITENNNGGTGILFQLASGPNSIFNFDGNVITLNDNTNGGITERGIIFSNVLNVPITISSRQNLSNTLTFNNEDGAFTIFAVPANATQGSIIINNTTVTLP